MTNTLTVKTKTLTTATTSTKSQNDDCNNHDYDDDEEFSDYADYDTKTMMKTATHMTQTTNNMTTKRHLSLQRQ